MKLIHVLGAAAFALAGPLHAQMGLFRPSAAPPQRGSGAGVPGQSRGAPGAPQGTVSTAPRVIVDPMGSPEVPFVDDRWEVWWEYNHDQWLALRPTLLQQGVAALTFLPVTAADLQDSLMPVLLRALRDPDDQVRSSAAFALARLPEDDIPAYLKHLALNDPHLSVRTHATLALGMTRMARNAGFLARLMDDAGTPDVIRVAAAVALGLTSGPEASAALVAALGDPTETTVPSTVRQAAAYALGLSEDPANAPALRQALAATRTDHRQRSLLVLALGRVGDRAANSDLVEALSDRETQVRRSAAIALGVTGRPADADVIAALDVAAEQDPDSMVRNFADLSLGRIAARGSPALVETLRRRLHDVTGQRRNFLVLALGIAGRAVALGDLLDQFRTAPSHGEKAAAAVALGLLGRDEATPLLRRALREAEDPYLESYLAFALGRLGDQESRDDLRRLVQESTSPATVRWAGIGLALLGDTTLPELLESCWNGSDNQVLRGTDVHVLGLTGDRRVIRFLTDVCQGQEPVTGQVRALATYSLGLLTERARVPTPARFTQDNNYTLDLTFLEDLYFLF